MFKIFEGSFYFTSLSSFQHQTDLRLSNNTSRTIILVLIAYKDERCKSIIYVSFIALYSGVKEGIDSETGASAVSRS